MAPAGPAWSGPRVEVEHPHGIAQLRIDGEQLLVPVGRGLGLEDGGVAGGVDDFAKAIERKVQGWGTEHDPQTTLFVCFVGKPRVRFAG